MMRSSIEPRTRKYVKGYGFLSHARKLSKKYKKPVIEYRTMRTILFKICFQKGSQ